MTLFRRAPGYVSAVAGGISILANAAGTFCILLMVAVISFDVIARGLFNAPFHGAVEVVQFSMVLVVFLQLPDVVRVDRLTRSDGFLLLLEHRRPRAGRYLRRGIDLLAALFMAAIAVAIWPQFLKMWATGDYFGVPGVFTAPWWPIKLVILGSTGLCTVLLVLKAAGVTPERRGSQGEA